MIQPQQPQQPQRPAPITQHPLHEGSQMLSQMPTTPHSGAVHQLLHHTIPIWHQVNALKKAMGSAKKTSSKNNPGGLQSWG